MNELPIGEREDLQVTARDLGHWQGTVDERLAQHGEHLAKINGSMEKIAVSLAGIEKLLAIQSGGQTVEQHQQEVAQKWRMWAIGLAVTVVLALFAATVSAGITVYLATR